MPKISIIIPVYNMEKYLEKCITSVLEQTYSDFELILVNDGSKDKSEDICNEFARYDNRVKVIHKTNGGVSSARNKGLEEAQGEYIGFIDSDDYIEPTMYEVLLSNIQKYDADISFCGFKVIDEDKNIIERIQNSGKLHIMDQKTMVERETDMPWSIRLDTINKLFQKKIIEGLRFDTSLHCAEDTLFLHQAIRRAKKGVFVELPLYVNVRHAGSAMRGGLNPKYYLQSYETDYSIYDDIRQNYPELAEKSFLVLINNCIWKLEDVCNNLRGVASKDQKVTIREMRRYMVRLSPHILFCKSLKTKQKIGLYLIAANIKDRKFHYV